MTTESKLGRGDYPPSSNTGLNVHAEEQTRKTCHLIKGPPRRLGTRNLLEGRSRVAALSRRIEFNGNGERDGALISAKYGILAAVIYFVPPGDYPSRRTGEFHLLGTGLTHVQG